MTEEPKEVDTGPELEPIPTERLTKPVKVNGKWWLSGIGPKRSRVMFVYPVALEEEVQDIQWITREKYREIEPRVGKSPHWNILQRSMLRNGLDPKECFFVPIVRYLPDDKKHWTQPTKTMLQACLPLLEKDIAHINPEIIVCVGKKVFDVLMPIKRREDEIIGDWFFHKKYQCRIYPVANLFSTMKPDKMERFNMDFRHIKEMLDTIDGVKVKPTPPEFTVVHNAAELMTLVNKLRTENQTLLSVDCEWEGHQHVDGKLRSLQIAWDENHAAYIRFMDDQLNYAFDVPYKTAGALLGIWLNQPQVKYIGHHLSADLTWMAYWLGLEWLHKGVFDTEFTLQCCDESLDLGLDILALRYTCFGKYDHDLIDWKKANPDKCKEGYGLVPDDILIPYACLDVLTCMRAYPVIKSWMERQNLVTYYDTILNPLVTDVFTAFTLNGLPVDLEKMNEMREFYQWAKKELEKDFQNLITKEAERLLKGKLFAEFGNPGEELYNEIQELVITGNVEAARKKLRSFVPAELLMDFDVLFEHYLVAPSFNIRSKPQMARWLFEVKKLVPVKSTANKSAGVPSISWDKVLSYKSDEQRAFTPATDTATLEILSARYDDDAIRSLLELNAVGNICKAFLKEAEEDDEGNVVKEQGLHYWVASDGQIHGNSSVTETGRIRSWNPNSLNWPSYLKTRLASGLLRVIKDRSEHGQLPPQFKKYENLKPKDFPTIRSIVMARPGWCIVEADYQTAEMRGLAFISGDPNLLDIILKPDTNFALVKPEFVPEGVDPGDCLCRLKFPDHIVNPPDKDKYLMTYTVNGEVKGTFTEDMLQRNPDGTFVGPRFDVHWGAVEMAQKTAREVLDKKRDRGAGKVANFCVSGNTAILTKAGNVLIKDLTLDNLVWDGIMWVPHEGTINYGKRKTIQYRGLQATPDHLVWTDAGIATLLDARIRQATLIKAASLGREIAVGDVQSEPDRYTRNRRQEVAALCRGDMPTLWTCILEELGQLDTGAFDVMRLRTEVKVQNYSSRNCENTGTTLQLYQTTLLHRIAQAVERLQRQGHQAALQLPTRVHRMGIRSVPGRIVQGEGIRQNRQQRTLLEDQSQTGDEFRQSSEYEETGSSSPKSGGVYEETSNLHLQSRDAEKSLYERTFGTRDLAEVYEAVAYLQEETKVLKSCVETDVYDIINAGERHRFTANGYLVSNSSSYGASPTSIERKIEADIGHKPPEGTGEALLQAIEDRQPVATQFFHRMEEIPTTTGRLRAASGRIRHCHTFAKDIDGLTARTRDGVVTALGRECRNFFLQESVGSCASRACAWLTDFKYKVGLKGSLIVCLYDSCVVHCPVEERQVWWKAVRLYMYLFNGYQYEDRILRYPVDEEWNAGWSTKPSKEFLAQLQDPEWNPTPEHLRMTEQWLDQMCAACEANPKLSLHGQYEMEGR